MRPECDRPRRGLGVCPRALLPSLVWVCCASVGLTQAPKALVSKPGQMSLSRANLPAGVYQITFRLRIDKHEHTVTPLATLTVNSSEHQGLIYKQITPIHFDAPGTPKDFTFLFDNFKTQTVGAVVALARHKLPVPKLSVDKITVAPSPTLCIGTVWPGKVLYRTGEAAKGIVAVYNGTGKAQSVTLRCVLESDLDRTRALKEERLTLAPGQRRDVPVAWNTGKEEYGFALAATLADANGKPVCTRREHFSVADNLWKVGITQNGRGCRAPFGPGPNESWPVRRIKGLEDKLAAELAKPFAPVHWNYSNYVEFFAWSPDNYFCQAPEEDYWYSGIGNYTMGKRHLQLAVQWLHRRGIQATSYVLPASCGYGGDKAYQKHPEWFVYGKNGQLSAGYYQKKLEVGSTVLSPRTPWDLKLAPYALWINPNITSLAPIDAHVDQFVKSQKMFGWDGVRFDVFLYQAGGYDIHGNKIDGGDPKKKDALEVRAWAHMRDRLWKELGPGFVVGDNYDYELRAQNPGAWVEACRKGQLLMEEIPRSCHSPQSARNRWHDYMTYYHGVGNIVRGLGGHHLIIGLDTQHPVDHLYMNVFTYAMRAHPYAHQYRSDALPLGNYAQFATRYSALIWDIERVKPLPEPAKRIVLKSPRPVWGTELACVRHAPNGKRQYIVHLINPPDQERIYTDSRNRVPPPIRNVQVSLKTTARDKVSRAVLLSADPDTQQAVLPIAVTAGQVTATVPQLHFWSIVIFE